MAAAGQTAHDIARKFVGDVNMLRKELVIGYLVAGFAVALVPHPWLNSALHGIHAVPVVGSALVLVTAVALSVLLFGCSMAYLPIAGFLITAGVLWAPTLAFVFGSVLIPPLVQIYRKSFAPKITWTFVGCYVIGACLGGWLAGHSSAQCFEYERWCMTFETIANPIAIVVLTVIAVLHLHGKRLDARAVHDTGAPERCRFLSFTHSSTRGNSPGKQGELKHVVGSLALAPADVATKLNDTDGGQQKLRRFAMNIEQAASVRYVVPVSCCLWNRPGRLGSRLGADMLVS